VKYAGDVAVEGDSNAEQPVPSSTVETVRAPGHVEGGILHSDPVRRDDAHLHRAVLRRDAT